ncbi:amidohydrolase family protein [Saccharothrix longispora]|uniref:amidohydrolase family protein n=1 Tax=Saccharothrix longispora TaxID=33920 RepID=UPI0028FD960F|nr:amidohydrolase family protein [Saccharothrix longispora]MDU0288946.1 amidohydrolase family protein [Saccharothrix longispora]
MTRIDGDVVLLEGAALADGRSDSLRRGVSLLVERGVVTGLWEGDRPAAPAGARVVDASGATLVPGMVDSHAHLSMPGGAQWVQRGFDPSEELLAVAEENGELMVRAGIRWARDVGAPRRPDPATGGERALSLRLRDAWAGRADRPYLRAAGTWIARTGALPHGLAVEVAHGADLLGAARVQLDDGADLVKLYLDGPDRDTPPFSADEVSALVREAHARGAKVAAHAGALHGARVGAAAGVDSIEHGFELDRDAAGAMAAAGTTLVSTLGVLHSWLTFTSTSTVDRFTGPDSRAGIGARLEAAEEGVRLAHAAGVAVAGGSDFGGGSLRANQLAWEAESLVRAGLPPHEALAALTWRGGDLLGDPAAGRLVVGGPAHFSLVHGDPLSDPACLWRVWLTR